MLNKKIYPQSSPTNNLGFIGLIIVGCTSSNISHNMNDSKEVMESLKVKSSSTRSNKKEVFSLSEIIINKKTLENIKKLEPDWNGYNSIAIDDKVIASAFSLINQLERQPKIFPTGRGTLQFEFSNDDDYLEFEISTSENSFFEQKKNQESEGQVPMDKINEKVNEFFA